MKDTPEEIECKDHEKFLALSPQERLAMTSRLFGAEKELIRKSILNEHGPLEPGELRRRIFLRLYGDDFSDEERDRIADHLAAWFKTPAGLRGGTP